MPRVTITVPEKNAQPYRFHLDRQSVTLGRGSDNDIPIDCGSVSVRHAEMRRVGGGYELRDVGSTNGIKLADERYEVIPLRNGISVKLGDVAFDFMLTDDEQEALAREKPDDELPVMREPEMALPKTPPFRETKDQHLPNHAPIPVNREIGGYTMLLLVILALIAFGGGMSIRFHKDTGRSLMEAIKANRKPLTLPVKKAPDATVPDATVPDATVPDATVPDATVPDATAPPAATPDATVPAAVPDSTPEPAPATTEPPPP